MRLIKTRFSDMRMIRTLLEGAEAEAGRAGESMPGAEHLLLAALDLPDGTARRAFERVGADPSALRQAIEARRGAARARDRRGRRSGGRRLRRAVHEGRLSQQRVGAERLPGGREARP
jgi:ATP-dependent Clp protease ATP-binding subunit ClpA